MAWVDISNGESGASVRTKLNALGAANELKAPLASPPLTGVPTAPTAAPGTDTTQISTTAFVAAAVALAVTGLLDFKGNTDCSANPNYPAASKGDAYAVSVAGKIGGASGIAVDIGDFYVASADNAGGTQAAVGASWFILEHNLAGALLAGNNLSDLTNAATARTNLQLGTAAVKNTGTSGDTIPLLDGGLTTWAAGSNWGGNVTVTGTILSTSDLFVRGQGRFVGWRGDPQADPDGPGVEIGTAGGVPSFFGYNRTGGGFTALEHNALSHTFKVSSTIVFSVVAAGIDVVGEARCDTLRIDAAPAEAIAVASTHKITVSMNGTTYYLLATNVP